MPRLLFSLRILLAVWSLNQCGECIRALENDVDEPPTEAALETGFELSGDLAAVEQQTNNHSCCSCPAVDCEGLNLVAKQLVDALNEVIPGAWFLADGSLIGALRYGNNCFTFKSGKKNLVDSDWDIGLVVPRYAKSDFAGRLYFKMWELGWPGKLEGGRRNGRYFLQAPVKLPSKSCDEKTPSRVVRVDIQFVFVEKDTDGALRLTGEERYAADSWGKLVDKSARLHVDNIFPLKKCRWGGREANCPNKYLHVLTAKREGDDCRDLWKPLEWQLAVADLFEYTNKSCACALGEDDLAEVRGSILQLAKEGYASLAHCLPAAAASQAGKAAGPSSSTTSTTTVSYT
eukprot:TRINITY_DN24389_c0_g1_i3.p1 TRINITY_DN24389_c0_g1~~TRINITY_DN24389_c0_g1_i3.p1  ORF type:complete len:346 (-),score=42.10 TRINITY_DN24389_c0_g1_i3:249-1286(-)